MIAAPGAISPLCTSKSINGGSTLWDFSNGWESDVLGCWLDSALTDWKTSEAQEFITLNGADASAWDDRSNTNNAIQATESKQPLVIADPRQVQFNGATDILDITDAIGVRDIFHTGGALIFLVFIASDGEGNNAKILYKSNASTEGWQIFTRGESGGNVILRFQHERDDTSGRWDTDLDVAIDTWYIFTLSYDASDVANDPVIYKNGTLEGITEVLTPVGGLNSDEGLEFNLGNYPPENRTFDGSMSEVGVIKTLLTTATRQFAEGYLAWKNGREDDLPVGHPYKDAAPMT